MSDKLQFVEAKENEGNDGTHDKLKFVGLLF